MPPRSGDQVSIWYALLEGPQADVVHVKRLFPNSNLAFDEIDGKFALSSPSFRQDSDHESIIAAATELLTAINMALRLSERSYAGFELHEIAERRDGVTLFHRRIAAQSGFYTISGSGAAVRVTGVSAVGIAGSIGRPARSREERLVSLLQRDPAITDVATAMTTRPITWAAMNKAFESVKGLMSTWAKKRRGDHQGLVDRGWITKERSESFFATAGYHRHGYPKTPIKEGVREMPYDEAVTVVSGLFWRLVDEMEPV